MIKQIPSFLRPLALLLSLIVGLTTTAHDFEAVNSDGATIYYEITSDSTVSVAPGNEDIYDYILELPTFGQYVLSNFMWWNYHDSTFYFGNINIPSTVSYNNHVYTITAIGNCAFFNAGIDSVTIPTSVTSIGDYAFVHTGITSITISAQVTSIGVGTFFGCNNLTSISIPERVASIGDYAFGYCQSLRKVVIESFCSLPNTLFVSPPDTVPFNLMLRSPDTTSYSIDNLTMLSSNPPIVYRGINPFTGMMNTTFYGISDSTLIHVPCLAIGDYKSDMEWGKFSNYHGVGGEDTNLVRQACDKYIWLDGNAYSSDTIVSCTNPSICDSAATITLSLTVHRSPQRRADTIFLCDEPFPYVYGADTLYAFGEYLFHYSVEDNICDSIVDLMLVYRNLTDSTQLQMVTIEWGHCKLIWTPCEYASGYKIYREGIGSDPYDLVYTAPADVELTWVDKDSNPKSMIYRYKICAVDDSCGGKETRASYGASIHLMISNGANGSYNLQWTPYEGEMNYTAYNIYRGPDEENQELIATVPVSITSYSDFEASETDVFYSVTAVLTPRETKSSMEIRSNIVSPEWQLRATQGALIISYAEGSKLYIYDALGRPLKCIERATAEERVEVPSSGLYIVQQEGGISKKVTVLR